MHLLLEEESVHEKGMLFMFVFILKKNIHVLRSRKYAFFCQVPNYKFTKRRAVSQSNIMLVVTVHCIWFNLGEFSWFCVFVVFFIKPIPRGLHKKSNEFESWLRGAHVEHLAPATSSNKSLHCTLTVFAKIKLVSYIYFLYISATETDEGNENAGREISERPLFC